MSSTSGTSTSSVDRQLGRVKWFNNKAGYGFLTANQDGTDTDIFVHHSDVMVANEQYKYLVQGEYVEFVINQTNEGPHKFKAAEITGIKGGKLMCETRNEFRQMKTDVSLEASTPRVNSRSSSSMPSESTQPWKFAQKTEGAQGRGAQGRGAQGRGAQGRGAQGRGAQGRGAQGRGAQGRGAQ